jgi:hypothetical protein
LSSAWPRWALVFQSLIALDMASHYMHMYATLSMGGANQSHKKIDSSRSWVLYLYYNSRVRFLYLFSLSLVPRNFADNSSRLSSLSAVL